LRGRAEGERGYLDGDVYASAQEYAWDTSSAERAFAELGPGTPDADCVAISPGEEMSIRIDLRYGVSPFARRALEIIDALGLVLISSETRVVIEDIDRAIATSNAARFVADPAAFLDALTRR
jgi:hypothetical protein